MGVERRRRGDLNQCVKKAAAECLVKAYRISFNLPIIITRGNNVFGPRQYPEKLIPKFFLLLDRGKKWYALVLVVSISLFLTSTSPIHGDGLHRRSYIYVADVAEAFDLIMRKGVVGKRVERP